MLQPKNGSSRQAGAAAVSNNPYNGDGGDDDAADGAATWEGETPKARAIMLFLSAAKKSPDWRDSGMHVATLQKMVKNTDSLDDFRAVVEGLTEEGHLYMTDDDQ